MAGARASGREYDLRVALKKQKIARDLPLPSLTASKLSRP
jgi:hypothetical protein